MQMGIGVSRDIPAPLAIQIIPLFLPASRSPFTRDHTIDSGSQIFFHVHPEGNTENAHMEINHPLKKMKPAQSIRIG